MTFSEETLMAYADDELDAQTRGAVEAAMASDPEIAARVAQHKALRGELRVAFNNVLDEPIPQRLADAARGVPAVRREGNVIPLRRKTALAESGRSGQPSPQASASESSLGRRCYRVAPAPAPSPRAADNCWRTECWLAPCRTNSPARRNRLRYILA